MVTPSVEILTSTGESLNTPGRASPDRRSHAGSTAWRISRSLPGEPIGEWPLGCPPSATFAASTASLRFGVVEIGEGDEEVSDVREVEGALLQERSEPAEHPCLRRPRTRGCSLTPAGGLAQGPARAARTTRWPVRRQVQEQLEEPDPGGAQPRALEVRRTSRILSSPTFLRRRRIWPQLPSASTLRTTKSRSVSSPTCRPRWS